MRGDGPPWSPCSPLPVRYAHVLVAALLVAGSVVAPAVGATSGVVLGVGDALVFRRAERLAPA